MGARRQRGRCAGRSSELQGGGQTAGQSDGRKTCEETPAVIQEGLMVAQARVVGVDEDGAGFKNYLGGKTIGIARNK